MRKIQLILAFMVVCVCTGLSAANIVAPVQPSITLTDGVAVYFYNVGLHQTVNYDTSKSAAQLWQQEVQQASPFTLRLTDEGRYRFQVTDTRYIMAYSQSLEAQAPANNFDLFTIRDTVGGCLIQKAPESQQYNATHYLGFNAGGEKLLPNLTKGNIVWQLLPATDASIQYMARYALYETLLKADASGYAVSQYEAIYNAASSTPEELLAAVDELTSRMSFSQYGTVCGGDYAILLQDDPNHAWGRYDNYLRCYYTIQPGDSQILTATVKVDKTSSIYYEPYNYNTAYSRSGNFSDYYTGGHYNNNYLWQEYNTEYFATMNVYVDGKLVRTIDHHSLGRNGWRYFEQLAPGEHTIQWVTISPEGHKGGQGICMKNIRVYETPLVEVVLAEPGSLGTEVLYQMNRVQDVRNLKVIGSMNSADLEQIDHMDMLFALDLSDASLAEIPANMFNRDTSNGGKASKHYLHIVKLPYDLTTIGSQAFRCSYVSDLIFPATLKTIGESAFYISYLRELVLPEGVQSIGNNAFAHCYSLPEAELPDAVTTLGTNVFNRCFSLTKARLPKGLTAIPTGTFQFCLSLTDLPLHEGLTSIGQDAFFYTSSYNPSLPTTLTNILQRAFMHSAIDSVALQPGVNIGNFAFKSCNIRNLVIPENATLGNYCFANNAAMQTVELPTTFNAATNELPFLRYNNALKSVKLKAATVVSGDYKSRFFDNCGKNFVLQVPDFCVITYKQDGYWKDYTIEGFDNAEVTFWQISQPLTLTYRDRLNGNPDVIIDNNASLTINGTAPMTLNDLTTYSNTNWPNTTAMILSNCENVTINGIISNRIYTSDNIWYAISLPFDFRPRDITTTGEALYSIKYYDGASRAQNNVKVGNWKDLPADTIVTAGTGFIYRTNKNCTSTFRSLENGSRNTIVSNVEFAKSLAKNESANAAHKGWNLVGNPYQCYYNIHKLNTTAPITVFEHTMSQSWYNNSYVWRPSAGNYKAYSLIDDDYALLPNGAFFLQCPDEESSVTFPTEGRQLTPKIEDENGARARLPYSEQRKLIDLVLNMDGGLEDNTRVVFNDAAHVDYELNCDAGKFEALDANQPQLYTLGGDGIRYAINERPVMSGIVQLGITVPTDGAYTIGTSRNRQAGTVLLQDKLTGQTADITTTGYTFNALKGTHEDRFELVAITLATGIADLSDAPSAKVIAVQGGIQATGAAHIYSLDGRLVATVQQAGGFVPMTAGVYIVRIGGQSMKVTVK